MPVDADGLCRYTCTMCGVCSATAVGEEGSVDCSGSKDTWKEEELELGGDWQRNIDFFIPTSALANDEEADKGGDTARSRDNGELKYMLRSFAQNAPWVHHIWIAINGEAKTQPDIPPSLRGRVTVVDRCTFMPLGSCPSFNGGSVTSFMHLLPDLSEHFVMVEDDIFCGRPVTPRDFFDESGRPYVWRRRSTWERFSGTEAFHRVYYDPSVVDFPTPLTCSPNPHFWYPNRKSVLVEIHAQYPEFYAFLATHKHRYSSLPKYTNSQEEDPLGWMNWQYLRTRSGVYKNIDAAPGWWSEVTISEEGFQHAMCEPVIFMNVNDRFSLDNTQYMHEIELFIEFLECMFPDPLDPNVSCKRYRPCEELQRERLWQRLGLSLACACGLLVLIFFVGRSWKWTQVYACRCTRYVFGHARRYQMALKQCTVQTFGMFITKVAALYLLFTIAQFFERLLPARSMPSCCHHYSHEADLLCRMYDVVAFHSLIIT